MAIGTFAVRQLTVRYLAVGVIARTIRLDEFSPQGNFAIMKFYRKDFFGVGPFAVRIFCCTEIAL